ncbi:MAG: tetratricopeptide repeat protein [Caldimonas sp.]
MTRRALLFTDVVDSTLLAEQMGDARSAQAWAEHDRCARDLLVRHRGREIDRTDGFFLLFDDAGDAARYALAYHRALADLEFSARAGLHVGTVTLRENAPEDIARGAKPVEVEGLAKPFAARIMALASGGQTLLSAAARTALGDKQPEGAEIESHGHYRLKGIEAPVEVFELGVSGIAAFVAPADADKAHRVVPAGDLWRPVREVRHNLPAERDAFVGRAGELRMLASRVDAGVRLLTVLGPGGIGKTRLVRRYGWSWLGDWPGGIYFCDLSEARSLDGICFAVASALDVPLGKDDPVVQLGHAIAGRGHCLLILDNFEQVLPHAATTVGRWLDRAVGAAFVVTSRERLHLAGEEIFPIEPLSLDKEAIELFVARARAQRPDFVLTETHRSAVAEVVRLLDGLPLAIELAAARVRVLSPAQIVERLEDRFSLLAGARGAVARQATLRAAIDWSWDLLTPWEQAALSQCSVFEGGFTLEAAEAVLDLSGCPAAPPTLDAVQALVDKSLLRTWVPAAQSRYDIDEPYFGMYVSIREYAAEKLEANGPAAEPAAKERHGRYFARFGAEEALEALHAHGGVRRRHAIAIELDNLVAACRRAIGRNDGAIAVATYRAAWEVLGLQGPFSLGMGLGAQVLALEGLGSALRAATLATRARACEYSGRTEEAVTGYEQALALAREAGDRHPEGTVLRLLGSLRCESGQVMQALAHLQVALAIHRELGKHHGEGHTLGSLGDLHRGQGRMDEARTCYEAALAIHRGVGDRRFEGSALGNLGNLHMEQGRMEEARAHYEAALAIHHEMGDRRLEGIVLGNLAILHGDQGRMDEAREHCEAGLVIAREIGNRRTEGAILGNLGSLDLEQGRMDEARTHYEAALAIDREVGNRRFEGAVLGNLGNLDLEQGRFDEARAHFEAALAIDRQMGNRRFEGAVLVNLGNLHLKQGEMDDARAHFEAALAIACEVGDRRVQGSVLGSLGDVLARQGHAGEAVEAFRTGDALLREVGDGVELAKLLCAWGKVEITARDLGAARAALAEAATLAATTGAGPDSELGRKIIELREALASAPT